MSAVRQYSTLFTCLYDEAEPIGHLGRGTHYSIFRCIEWLDVTRRSVPFPQIHDFAVIWDEDHDERIIDAIERIYMAGLLSPVQFIGERKGSLTAIVAAKFFYAGRQADNVAYHRSVETITQELDDPWNAMIGSFDRATGSSHQNNFEGLINDRDDRVGIYLANIDSLWGLGTRSYTPPASSFDIHAPIAPSLNAVPPMPPSRPAPRPFPPYPLAPRA